MEQEAEKSDAPDSENVSELRSETYVVLNLLPPERLAWLREQSLRVAAVFTSVKLSTTPPIDDPA